MASHLTGDPRRNRRKFRQCARCMHRLRHQAHAPGNANAPDRLEARFAAGSKSFVQGFASDAGIFGGSGVDPQLWKEEWKKLDFAGIKKTWLKE